MWSHERRYGQLDHESLIQEPLQKCAILRQHFAKVLWESLY